MSRSLFTTVKIITIAFALTANLSCSAKNSMIEEKGSAPAAHRSTQTQAIQANNKRSAALMPRTLLGVWYQNSESGKQQCDRYKRMDPRRDAMDEASDPLIGSVVITGNVVHAYSEYGEGDIYSIQRVHAQRRGQWRIESLIYIDTLPSPDEVGKEVIDVFILDKGILFWGKDDKKNDDGKNDGMVRCGPVRRGFYSI